MGRPYQHKYGTPDTDDTSDMLNDLFVSSKLPDLDDTDESNQYLSQSYNKGGVINSHSVNRFELKKDNYLDKNTIEYQIVTIRRSKSKKRKYGKRN